MTVRDDDWAKIGDAIESMEDPLFGPHLGERYRALHQQIAITVQAIHHHRSLARSHVCTDWLHHPSLNVEITRGERPAWLPAWVPSLAEAWTFSTATGFHTAQR